MSLVQVLVAIGVMSILTTAMVSTTVNQSRQLAVLQAQLASADFQILLTAAISKPGLCTSLVGGRTFDSTNATTTSTNPPSIDLPQSALPGSTLTGATNIAAAGEQVSPLSHQLKFKAMPNTFQVTEIRGEGGNSFKAFFQANYDYTDVPRGVKPARASLILTTTNSGSTHTVTSCMIDAPPPPVSALDCHTVVSWAQVNCTDGYKMVGGGCTTPTGGNIIAIHTSIPSGNGWYCAYEMCWGSCTVAPNGWAHAVCCRSGP